MKWLFPKRFIVSIVISASILSFAAQPAAADKPVRGCPNDQFVLVPVDPSDPVDVAVDLNGDGRVCEKPIPAFPPGSFNVIDNTSNSDH